LDIAIRDNVSAKQNIQNKVWTNQTTNIRLGICRQFHGRTKFFDHTTTFQTVPWGTMVLSCRGSI
jgi:hypothetical protein